MIAKQSALMGETEPVKEPPLGGPWGKGFLLTTPEGFGGRGWQSIELIFGWVGRERSQSIPEEGIILQGPRSKVFLHIRAEGGWRQEPLTCGCGGLRRAYRPELRHG